MEAQRKSENAIENLIENGENQKLETSTCNLNLTKTCTIYKRFWCKGERVNVINCPNDPGASFENKKYKKSDGTIVNLVMLGSREHFKKLEQAIEDAKLRLDSIKLKLLDQTSDFDTVKGEQDVIELEKEMQQRIDELLFLQENCPTPIEDIPDDDIESGESIASDDVLRFGENMENIDSLSATNDSTLHVTSETFGRLKQLVIINHKKQENMLHIPVPRQYFIGSTLYRESKTYKVQNIELFTDLIYVGCIGKCESLIEEGGFSWLSFLELLLVLLPILSRWRQMTHLKNMIHHHDLFSKLYHFIYSCVVIFMGISITHSFDLSGETNTGNLFIGFHFLGECLIDLYLAACGLFFMPRFRYSLLMRMSVNVSYIVPFLVLFGYPANGTEECFNIRLWLWGFGVLFENITPLLWMTSLSIFKNLRTENRVAINIEHLSARHTLLVLIALGGFMVYLLGAGDFALGSSPVDFFNVMFAFMSALSLYNLYFRAETTSHHQHALRRNNWTGVTWGLLHVPVVVFITVVSVCFYQIWKIAKTEDSSSIQYSLQSIFGTSYAALFFCFCAFSLIHLDSDPQANKKKNRPRVIKKGIRIVVNFIVGILFLVLGLSAQISAQPWIYVASCLCLFAAIVEEIGRLKKRV